MRDNAPVVALDRRGSTWSQVVPPGSHQGPTGVVPLDDPIDGTLHLEDVMPDFQRPDELPWLLPPEPDKTLLVAQTFDDATYDLADRLGVNIRFPLGSHPPGCGCMGCSIQLRRLDQASRPWERDAA